MSESIEKIAKKEDPKMYAKMFKILPHIATSKPTYTRTCSKLIEESKELPILLGKKIKTVVHPYATHGEVYQIIPSKSK